MNSAAKSIDAFHREASKVILDKNREITLALCCILARGHLLIEDIPGVGKTTLILTLAKLLNLQVNRIQFTNDLLPGDILGSSIFDPEAKKFKFHAGPIFSQLVLADELNRATPKTQSACLQAMEERRVSVDGITHHLPEPFIFVATQNPKHQIGTFPLPESQLDRFLMKIEIGYPNRAAERLLLLEESRHELIDQLESVFQPGAVLELQKEVRKIHASEAIISYVQDLVALTREGTSTGLSPRAAIGFLTAAKAWAFVRGSDFLLPEDIQAVAVPVMAHRLQTATQNGVRLAQEIVSNVAVK